MGKIQTYQQKLGTFRDLLDRMKNQFAMAAPRHLTPDRIMRLAMNQFQRIPKLMDCTPQSVLGSLMTCTQIGLEPDDASGRAYLIPYKDVCTLVIGYRGLIELAHRSEKLSTIEARVVRDDDVFEVRCGTDSGIKHVPALGSDKPVIAAYAVATMRDGGVQFEVMSRREIDAIRQRSASAKSSHSPWQTDYEEMARKTAARRLCKYLPSSAELQRAVSLDEQQDAGLPQDLSVAYQEDGGDKKPKTLDDTVPKEQKQTESTPAGDGSSSVVSGETASKIRSAWKSLKPEQRERLNKQYDSDLGKEALSKTGFESWSAQDANDLYKEIEQAVETGN